jgi:hypothetical protein
LVNAAPITLGWNGILASSRGGTGVRLHYLRLAGAVTSVGNHCCVVGLHLQTYQVPYLMKQEQVQRYSDLPTPITPVINGATQEQRWLDCQWRNWTDHLY